jgi:hypothetical protein
MNLRLEQLAKWALLTALIVLIGAPTFNKQTIAGENKMAGLADLSTNIAQPGSGFAYNSGSGMGGGGGGGTGGEPFTAVLGSSSVADGAISYGNDGSMQIYRNGSWQPFNQDTGAPTAGLSGTTVDPYAAKKAAGRNAFNEGRNVFNSSINSAIDNSATQYGRTIRDTITGWNGQQTGLDNKAINANMAKTQGQNGILQMVGQGIRSAGTMLGNRNAGSSSASQAIADAYGKLGQQQASQVGNQYEIANNQINTDQGLLDAARATQLGDWTKDKTTVVNNIVTEAQKQISAINANAANASISDRMDMAAEAERIRQQAITALQQYDSELTKISQAQSNEQRQSKAAELARAGTANPVQFQYSTQMPGQFQNTGDFSSSMPLFTYGSNKYKNQG